MYLLRWILLAAGCAQLARNPVIHICTRNDDNETGLPDVSVCIKSIATAADRKHFVSLMTSLIYFPYKLSLAQPPTNKSFSVRKISSAADKLLQ